HEKPIGCPDTGRLLATLECTSATVFERVRLHACWWSSQGHSCYARDFRHFWDGSRIRLWDCLRLCPGLATAVFYTSRRDGGSDHADQATRTNHTSVDRRNLGVQLGIFVSFLSEC